MKNNSKNIWGIINTIGLIVLPLLLIACITILILNITVGF